MRNLNKQGPGCIDVDMPPHSMGAQHGNGPQWSDDESDLPPPKRIRACEAGYASDHTAITDYDEGEPRVWTQQHLEAADIRQRPDPAILTPPSLVSLHSVKGFKNIITFSGYSHFLNRFKIIRGNGFKSIYKWDDGE